MSEASIPNKPNNRILSDEEIKQLYRRYDRGGITYAELAKYHCVSQKTVQRYIHDRKIIVAQLKTDPPKDWLSMDQIELNLGRCVQQITHIIQTRPVDIKELPYLLRTAGVLLNMRAHLIIYPIEKEIVDRPVDNDATSRLVMLVPPENREEFVMILKSLAMSRSSIPPTPQSLP